MNPFKRLLKWYAPMAFGDGLNRCNQLALRLARREPWQRLLDVGCGDGELTAKFLAGASGRRADGIEYVAALHEAAGRRGIACRSLDVNLPWTGVGDSAYDLVLSSQNIEHVHNTRLYLEECRRCLKPGGRLLVLTENLASWINIGALLFGWQPFSTTNIDGWSVGNPCVWHADEPKDMAFVEEQKKHGVTGTTGHIRVWTRAGLADLLKRVGFEEVRLYGRGYLPFWGWLSDCLSALDGRHSHFLVASARKPGGAPA